MKKKYVDKIQQAPKKSLIQTITNDNTSYFFTGMIAFIIIIMIYSIFIIHPVIDKQITINITSFDGASLVDSSGNIYDYFPIYSNLNISSTYSADLMKYNYNFPMNRPRIENLKQINL